MPPDLLEAFLTMARQRQDTVATPQAQPNLQRAPVSLPDPGSVRPDPRRGFMADIQQALQPLMTEFPPGQIISFLAENFTPADATPAGAVGAAGGAFGRARRFFQKMDELAADLLSRGRNVRGPEQLIDEFPEVAAKIQEQSRASPEVVNTFGNAVDRLETAIRGRLPDDVANNREVLKELGEKNIEIQKRIRKGEFESLKNVIDDALDEFGQIVDKAKDVGS